MTPNPTDVDDRSTEHETSSYYVLGSRHVGPAVARRLRVNDHTVCVLDELNGRSETSGFEGDQIDVQTLETAGVGAASAVVVATESDSRNLLIAQLVRACFDVTNIIVLTNVPEHFDMFREAGHNPVCATSALSDALVNTI
ncbi:NAD-binding protein [Halocatena marina]|uniref:NAD-binding protein n=1 Tax=Halocatena marina TaxID=2934937 RepID=UPI0035A1544D